MTKDRGSSSNNLPDVFHLKTLNNVSNKDGNGIKATDIPIITNPMCQCRCHVHQQPSQSNKDMKLMRPKLLRTKLFCLVVTTFLLVMVGLCIAYLFVKVNHQYHHHHHQTIRPMSPLVHQPHQVNNRTLQDVFISVKTTKKYHYPRLIIQLETWASLVRSQVHIQIIKLCIYGDRTAFITRSHLLNGNGVKHRFQKTCNFVPQFSFL